MATAKVNDDGMVVLYDVDSGMLLTPGGASMLAAQLTEAAEAGVRMQKDAAARAAAIAAAGVKKHDDMF